MPIRWDVSKSDSQLISRIVARAAAEAESRGEKIDRRNLAMDITAVHMNGCPLQLAKLLEAPPFDFAHDIAGIQRRIDRTTGKLDKRFLPRYAYPME